MARTRLVRVATLGATAFFVVLLTPPVYRAVMAARHAEPLSRTPEPADIGAILDQAQRATNVYRQERMIREGPCEGKYRPIPDGALLVPEEALRSIDPTLLKNQIDQLSFHLQGERAQQATEQATLAAIKGGQKDGVFEWLRQSYGSLQGRSIIFIVENRITVVTPWLFGTFVASYPREIRTDEGRQVQVTFTPAIYAGDSPPNVSVRPAASYAGAAIPDNLEFTPRDLSAGDSTGRFQLGQWTDIDPKRPTTWTWEAKPSRGFKGADFGIVMEAAQKPGLTPVRTAAKIPVQIGLEPEKSFWERHDALVAGILSALVASLTGVFFGRWWGRT